MSLRGRKLLSCLAVATGAAACNPESKVFQLVTNVCASNVDCEREQTDGGVAPRCDLEVHRCTYAAAEQPYTVVYQVTPPAGNDKLVARLTLDSFTLQKSPKSARITVPEAIKLEGSVRGVDDAKLAAEVSFTPAAEVAGFPVAPVVVYTSANGGTDTNLRALLAPNTRYRVHVQPLRADSQTHPPSDLTLDTGSEQSLRARYPALASVSTRVVDPSGAPRAFVHMRLVSKTSGEVISSTHATDENGQITLYAENERLSQGYEFMLGVAEDTPWRVAIRADSSRRVADNSRGGTTLTVPSLPLGVTYEGDLEFLDKTGVLAVDGATLVFISAFRLPMETGAVGNRDWCRSRVPFDPLPPFVCSADITTIAGTDGSFSVPLLPGTYDIFVRPSTASNVGRRVATKKDTATIETREGSRSQIGQSIALDPAIAYAGRVITADKRTTANVSVRATSLGLAGTIGEVARYSRDAEVLTNTDGHFQLVVDRGYYDLSIRPSVESGFAWSYLLNRIVDTSPTGAAVGLEDVVLRSPVVAGGHIVDPAGIALAGASIDAYAIVDSLDGKKRALQVAHADADMTGAFELLLPTTLGPLEP